LKAIIKKNPNNVDTADLNKFLDEVMYTMGVEYIDCFDDMGGRAPGGTCGGGVRLLSRLGRDWRKVPYSSFGGGCGASMRSAGIGLLYHGAKWRDQLIAISIESGRLTHNHPTGFLGAMVASAFTALALEGVPTVQWGTILLKELLPRSRQYLQQCGRDWNEIERDMKRFEEQWTEYLTIRGLLNVDETNAATTVAKFPEDYGVAERDEFYNKWSFRGWAGASGDDSVIIAYDALLGAGDDWENLMERGALHAGDSDSTATIAGAWWGGLYGFHNVPTKNTAKLEKKEELEGLANSLHDIRSKMDQ
jgi:ADP-ribosylarginine hydrolase